MTKKKKPKDKLTGASPSNSSGSQFSDKASSDLAADPSDLRVLALSDSAVSPDKADEPSVEPTGAVTATIYDRAQQNPSFDLAIAALDIAHVSYVPSVEPSGAVTATISDSEPIGAVAATNPESEPTGAVTAGIPAPGYTGAVTDTTSDVVSVNPTSENVDAVTAILEEGEFVPPPSPSPTTDVSPPVPVENARLKEHSTRSQPREDNTGPGPKSPAEHWRRLRKDKAPIASQLPIVDIPPAKEPRPPPSILDKKNPSQETLPSSSRAPQKELTLSDKARLPNLNNLLTVDLSASGFISSGQSAQGSTDYATTSISDNFSEEDDNPQIEADRYLQEGWPA
ncbi:hypothetical protein Bca101_088686 [Brassica carinata]